MNPESAFNDLDIDAITGTKMLEWLGLTRFDLNEPSRFSKLRDVINFFKRFPEDTQHFLITRTTSGKTVDKLNHVWEYAKVMEKKEGFLDSLKEIEAERSALGATSDPVLLQALDKRSLEARQNIENTNKELELYEK